MPLMQMLSHKTRAYLWNADGLKGFLIKMHMKDLMKLDILVALREAQESGDIYEVTKHQEVKIDSLMKELAILPAFR